MPVAPLPHVARPRRGPNVVVVAAMVFGLVAGLVDLTPRSARAAAAWTTTALNLRSGPGLDYGVILVMPAGAYVEIVQNLQNGFYRVRYDGVSGWAYADYLTRSNNGGGTNGGSNNGGTSGGGGSGNATVAVNGLNLRAGAGTNTAVLAVMPYGAAVSLTGNRSNGFVSVTYQGTSGWAYESFLSSGGSSGGNPSPDPAPSAQDGPTGSATIAVNALNLRAGAGTNTAVLAVMPRGSGVTLTGQRANGFVSVTYGGTDGWAYESYLSIGSSPAPSPDPDPAPAPQDGPTGPATVAVNALNLRASATTNSGVLAVMPRGAGLTLTGQRANGFVSVTYQGIGGWAYESYLNVGAVSAAPDPDPAPAPQPNQPAPGSGTAMTTANMNMRTSASTSAAVITVVPAGATVNLTGVAENGFYRVQYNGTLGWISSIGLVLGGTPNGNSGGALTEQQIIQIIYDAADRYGQPREDMLRVARCESNLNPNAVNPSGSYGLFQFIRSTWASTPYADYDIFDAWASANAAGWMWSVGRRNEWVCQ